MYSTSLGRASKAALNLTSDSGKFSYEDTISYISQTCSKMFTYRDSLRSSIVIYRDINEKVGVADLVAQKIRTLTISVVLADEIVVLRSSSILVLCSRPLFEVSDPLSLDIRLAWFSEVDGKHTLQST